MKKVWLAEASMCFIKYNESWAKKLRTFKWQLCKLSAIKFVLEPGTYFFNKTPRKKRNDINKLKRLWTKSNDHGCKTGCRNFWVSHIIFFLQTNDTTNSNESDCLESSLEIFVFKLSPKLMQISTKYLSWAVLINSRQSTAHI